MFDNFSKFLADEYPQDFASWLIGQPIQLTELPSKELSSEPIRADSVILLRSSSVILHCEFQTDPDDDIGFRMADYALRIFRKFPEHELFQVIIYLRKTGSEKVHITTFQGNNFQHSFQVIRLWEQPTEVFLKRPGLWAYAALTNTDDRSGVLRKVAQRIDALDDRRQQANLSAVSAVMGGLSLEKDVVQRILRRELMQESVMYQEMQAWARADVEKEVSQRERETGERSLILRLLRRRVGELPDRALAKINELSLDQLESLGEALLDFALIADLTVWLEEKC